MNSICLAKTQGEGVFWGPTTLSKVTDDHLLELTPKPCLGCAWSWGGNPEGQKMEFGSYGPMHFIVFHSCFSKGVLEEDGGLKVVYSCETKSAICILLCVVGVG